ncbi:redoxin domain-containing protein, partial [Salmonella enterica subsp. enterica serovar Montevideo]|nr:redoxin domain-containing protein [Salmonella enterica subsp. enterica serovar Montevideo]
MALISVLNVVSQTHLVAIAPRWLAEEFAESLELQILPLPLFKNQAFKNGEFIEVTEKDTEGRWSVFFFYPADFTFVCPTELG